jgi:hypothetical protein
MRKGNQKEPLFLVETVFAHESAIPKEYVITKEISDFILPPEGKSEIKDFDTYAHIDLVC